MIQNFKFKIQNWLEDHKKEAVWFLTIFLVSTISFGLGYLIANEFNRAPIIIEKASGN